MNYILSSAVITNSGVWEYTLISEERAKKWLAEKEWTSRIGYPDTARAASLLFERKIGYKREYIEMLSGEEALVFRLVFPSGSPGIPTKEKGNFSLEFVQQYCEIGLLRHLGGRQGKHVVIETWQEIRPFLNEDYIKSEYDISRSSLYPNRLERGWLGDDARKKLSKFFNKIFHALKHFG